MAFSLAACNETPAEHKHTFVNGVCDCGETDPDYKPDGNGEQGGEDGDGEITDPIQLIAPVISLSNNVISWSAVAHANYYEVYENGNFAVRNTATSYTITKTAVGEYVYKVRAISASTAYTASDYSNAVTYTVEPKVEPAEPLSAPVIELNENEITWSAVENATAYEIYENEVKIGQVKTTSYTISTTLAGEWVYAVKAISSDTARYSPSELSNTVTYSVAVREVGFLVTVTVPTGYTAAVQVALYKDGETTPVETKPVTVSGTQGSVEFNQSNKHAYTASVVAVAAGYKATSVRLTASNMEGEIKIISLSGSKVLKVGVNSFRVANNDDAIGADQIYYFVADVSGMYTIDATGESKDMYISVGRTLYIDVVNEQTIASFYAEAGVPMEITVVGFVSGTFSFEIKEGEVRQSLNIGIGYGNRPNYIYGDCTRDLTVTTPGYYIFEFGYATLGGRLITLTIDGVDYVFGTWDGEDVENVLTIPLNRGNHEVSIKTEGFTVDDEIRFCTFFIYLAE